MALTFNKTKSVQKSLKFNYGVGTFKIRKMFKSVGLNLRCKFKKIKKKIKSTLIKRHQKILLNYDLKQHLRKRASYNYTLKTYKALRNKKGLPSRGQRTHTNGKTKKKLRF